MATTIFYEESFNDEPITCPNCGWKGTGADTHIVDFYGVVRAREVHCPNCDNKLGDIKENKTAQGNSGDELSNQIG